MQAQELATNTAAWYSAVASAGFHLPGHLVPANTLEFTTEDKGDFDKFVSWARTSAQTSDDWNARTEMAMTLFLDQRRKQRTWVIGCSVLAAVLGGVMGYYIGKPAKGGA